jgi:hypothetical protein
MEIMKYNINTITAIVANGIIKSSGKYPQKNKY